MVPVEGRQKCMKRQLCFALAVTILVSIISILIVQLVFACYGPQITATLSKTEVILNENVTITGQIYPIETNKTVRVCFVRPDLTWIDRYIPTNNETGEFSLSQKLDMAGFWNIFPINDHINDRLYANVTDISPDATEPTFEPPPFKPNVNLFVTAGILVTIGAVVAILGRRNKTKKISSLRLFIQVALVFLIFFGMFVDHQYYARPLRLMAVHEVLVGDSVLGVSMPDGIPVPFFACYYPCGKTVTCALWEMQTYIFPHWDAGHGYGVDYNASGLVRLGVVFGVLILLAVLLGKIFCGWVCPFGLYMDLVTKVRKALKIKHRNFSEGFNEKFHQLGYVILALIIILSVMFGSYAIAGTQLIPGTEQGGFTSQYFSAPFCQVCPMKPLAMLLQTSVGILMPEWVFGTTTGQFYELGYYVTSLNLLVLGVVTLAAFFYRRLWCRICPLGALMALFSRFPPFKWFSIFRLDKVEEKCTKCGICKRVCPTQETEVYEKKGGDVTTSKCIMCLRCVEMCPHPDTLKLKAIGKPIVRSRNWLER